jgi:hypothetical protein
LTDISSSNSRNLEASSLRADDCINGDDEYIFKVNKKTIAVVPKHNVLYVEKIIVKEETRIVEAVKKAMADGRLGEKWA